MEIKLIVFVVLFAIVCYLVWSDMKRRQDFVRSIKERAFYDTERWVVITPYGYSEYEGFSREYLAILSCKITTRDYWIHLKEWREKYELRKRIKELEEKMI